MSRTLMLALAGLVVLAGAEAGTAGVPSKKGDTEQDAAEQDAAGKTAAGQNAAGDPGSVDLESELNPVRYARLIKPIEVQLAAAAKVVKIYAAERAKPVDRQNGRLLLACNQRAAGYYLGAALAARRAVNRLREERLKNAVKEQYQRPSEQKAVEVYLELAEKAREEGNVREAVGYYKRVLKIDRDNARAARAVSRLPKSR